MSTDVRHWMIAFILIAAAGRAIWFGQFLILAVRHHQSGSSRGIRGEALVPRKLLGNKESAASRYSLYFTHQVAAFTLGGLALAAWAVLQTNSSSSEDGRFTLGLLAITVSVSISAAVIFRVAGSEMSRMGYESALAISSLSLVFAMFSMIEESFDVGHWTWFLFGIASLLIIRDLIVTFEEMKITRDLVTSVAPEQPKEVVDGRLVSDLQDLRQLHDGGSLSDEQFEAAKAKLLRP